MTKTAEDFRNEAAAANKRVRDSNERCDPGDNFVSNWASGLSANLADTKAELLDAGKVGEFTGLYAGDRRVSAKEIKTRFGYAWLLNEAEEGDLVAKRGKVFLPTGKKSRILKELGLVERRETAPAWACMDGEGYGLSGRAWVIIFRTGDKWGSDAKLVEGGA